MLYHYKGKDTKGRPITSVIDSLNEKTAINDLRNQGIFVTSIKPPFPLKFDNLKSIIARISFSDIVHFTQQLSTMISAGLPLSNSLNILGIQSTNKNLQNIVKKILKDVEGGTPLSDALSKYPQQFSNTYVTLIKAGEASGKLDEILARLTTNLEKEQEFRMKTQGALLYPAIIIIGMVIVMFLMITFVVPKLSELYTQFSANLPLSTTILIALSNFFAKYWIGVIIVVVVGIIILRYWKNTPSGNLIFDEIILNMPIIGHLKKQLMFTEMCRTLGLLANAGIPILNALMIARESLDSISLRGIISEIAQKVEKGMPLGVQFTQYPIIPPILGNMVSIGEETGKLDEILMKLSRYFELEAEQGVKTLTTSMEPLIMVVMGIGVGFMVFAIIMPIYSLTSQF